MKRVALSLAIGYTVLGLATRGLEAAGIHGPCGCDSDCWCKRPGLSVFRWVFPRFHKNRSLAAYKRSVDPSR